MEVYELIQSLMGAQPHDKVIITDNNKNEYELDYARTDNGFVEIVIISKDNIKE